MLARCEAGDKLTDMLLVLFAAGTLDAKSVCILAHHASEAGVDNDGLKKYALRPGLQTGKYSHHHKNTCRCKRARQS